VAFSLFRLQLLWDQKTKFPKRKLKKKNYFDLSFDDEAGRNTADAGGGSGRTQRSEEGGIQCLMLCILRCR